MKDESGGSFNFPILRNITIAVIFCALGPLASASSLSGTWVGSSAQGEDVYFLVGGDKIDQITFGAKVSSGFCTATSQTTANNVPIVQNAFSYSSTNSISGIFETADAARGSLEVKFSGGCANATVGSTWQAHKLDSPLVTSVLPTSRSISTESAATYFATVINGGAQDLTGCEIGLFSPPYATDFSFQTTDPATNALTGSPNEAVDIAAGEGQTFVLTLTPTSSFFGVLPREVLLKAQCDTEDMAPIFRGVNTFMFSSSVAPVPDIIALSATLSNDGIVNIENGSGVFAVATTNLGAGDNITARVKPTNAEIDIDATICETDPGSGACLAAPDSEVISRIETFDTPTFGIFVRSNGLVPFDPATNRLRVRFLDSEGNERGSTSVAVRTN